MNKIDFIKSKNLDIYRHGFFTKKGGVSSGIYSSLNCGFSSKDKKENIIRNRQIIATTLGLKSHIIIVPNQTHSNKVNIIKKKGDDLNCDGLINFSSELAVGVLTADCCPLLFGHQKKKFSGCLHIGWKGLYSGIIFNFIKKIRECQIDPKELIVSIGPSIGKHSYQVSNNFRDGFIKNDDKSRNFFSFKIKNKSFYFDLKGYVKFVLNTFGIRNIMQSKEDTYKKNDTFFSYRFSCHKGIKDYGRMLSVIENN